MFWFAAAAARWFLPWHQSSRFLIQPAYHGRVSKPVIDLHAHTTASDGSVGPGELVSLAATAGVDIIAITDHDTTAGWEEALAHGQRLGVGVVPGIELSAQILDETRETPPLSVHLLGYLVDPDNASLREELATIRSHRDDRLRLMVEALAKDVDISWEEVASRMAPGATAGRPHIADVLVDKGIVQSVSEAFAYYLAGDGPYHVPHYAPRLHRAIDIIRLAGGVPILAHPLSGNRRFALDQAHTAEALTKQLADLAAHGLAGVEVFHRENTPDLVPVLDQVARELGLIRTGSSDFHGTKKPNRLAEHVTELSEFQALVAQATGIAPLMPSGWDT